LATRLTRFAHSTAFRAGFRRSQRIDDAALTFFRDVLGLPEREAYSADGGAEVTTLEAGVATLEIANRAQVEFIDRVETDGHPKASRSRSSRNWAR
jgi:hypothetical protein